MPVGVGALEGACTGAKRSRCILMRPDGRRITKRIRYGRGAVSLGLPDCGVILTFYQVLASAHAAENFLVAPPLNWVVREEADAILAISEDIKISTGSGRRVRKESIH